MDSNEKVIYAQIIVGAPGAGKTTYCTAMKEFLSQIGREALIINLDPANENPSSETSISISELISVDSVMLQLGLGPNGALIYCMEWLHEHHDKLFALLSETLVAHPDCRYLLFDFPGQIELYTSTQSVQQLLNIMTSQWHIRGVVVHLTDATLCSDPAHYISALLVSLSIMLNLALPHVNILSKADLLQSSLSQQQLQLRRKQKEYPQRIDGLHTLSPEQYDGQTGLRYLSRQIDAEFHLPSTQQYEMTTHQPTEHDQEIGFYHNSDDETESHDSFHFDADDDDDDDYDDYDDIGNEPFLEKSPSTILSLSQDERDEYYQLYEQYKEKQLKKYVQNFTSINREIANLLEDYSLIQLVQLSIHDKHAMLHVLQSIDKANGYAFRDVDLNTLHLHQIKQMVQQSTQTTQEHLKQFGQSTQTIPTHEKYHHIKTTRHHPPGADDQQQQEYDQHGDIFHHVPHHTRPSAAVDEQNIDDVE